MSLQLAGVGYNILKDLESKLKPYTEDDKDICWGTESFNF